MFDGETVTKADTGRLATQLNAVLKVMSDGLFRGLEPLAAAVTAMTGRKATVPSVSARLRDLRKDKFGGHTIERKGMGDGLFQYRLL